MSLDIISFDNNPAVSLFFTHGHYRRVYYFLMVDPLLVGSYVSSLS
jgi:hypothetical protein